MIHTASRLLKPARSLCLCVLLATVPLSGAEAPENVARGATYTLHPAPNYVHCTDPGDRVQLTDGESTTGYFWTQKGTVGWRSARYAAVTVDLGDIQPISGVALTTAAGVAGVTWPAAVHVLVSDDGEAYRDAGDLVALDRVAHGPWPEGYAIRRLETHHLATRGRFVRFVMIPPAGGPYIFTDEVEVFRGPVGLLQKEPPGPVVEETGELFRSWRTRSSIQHRFSADAAGLVAAIQAADLRRDTEDRLVGKVREVASSLDAEAVAVDRTFRAVLPYNGAHARLFGLQAELWRILDMPAISLRAVNPWEPLDLFLQPPRARSSLVEVHAMLGEHRAGSIVIFNASERPTDVRVFLDGVPGAPSPEYVRVHEVPWTDTGRGTPVAAALPEAPGDGVGWRIPVLPGIPQQIWFTFRPTSESKVGDHRGRIVVEQDRVGSIALPLHLRVYPFRFPRVTSLWVGGWSYTNGDGRYGVTSGNRRAFVKHLQERFVNAPWAGSSVMMRFRFTGSASDPIELETSEFDAWIAEWPNARAYLVFLAVAHHSGAIRTSIGDVEVGSAEFDRRVGIWISAWARHLESKGIAANRLGLLIHDEPHEGSDIGPLVHWARAIQAAEPDVLIWEDPTYRAPGKAPPELFEVADVLCPNRPMWLAAAEPFREFYREQRRLGRTLHFYSCSGPARLLDPYAYYRLQAWECFQQGATGSFFWAFGDNSGASSWNEYLAKAGPYTPLFLDDSSVTAGKHMEAIRESVEDYETFCMLRAAVERARAEGRGGALLEAAESLLERGVGEVLSTEGMRQLYWHDPKDRSAADRVRVRALEALLDLAPP